MEGKGKFAVTQRIWACVSYDTNDVPIEQSEDWTGATRQSEPLQSKYSPSLDNEIKILSQDVTVVLLTN